MQAAVQFTNGINATDIDHTFTTQAVPANMQPNLTVTTAAGMTPQPGVEMLDMLGGAPSGAVVTDLDRERPLDLRGSQRIRQLIQGIKLLPNGDFLMGIGPSSGAPLNGGVPAGTINEIREVNLAGDTVREITIDDLNLACDRHLR